MGKYLINGGNRLKGEIKVQGAKNSVLPILAATVLNKNDCLIHNCPNILDVDTMIKILKQLGCSVERKEHTLKVNTSSLMTYKVPEHLVREMRSSIILLGAILSRCHEVLISFPGGCSIGHRPIDIHLKALKQLGVEIEEKHGYIHCRADKIKGESIIFDFPSVGATENVMLAAVYGEGTTVIHNPAKEPEIKDLQDFLNSMGAKVKGAGSDIITIEGVDQLHSAEFTVISDRIVSGTYMMATAITGGDVCLRSVNRNQVHAVISKLKEMNCDIIEANDYTQIKAPDVLSSVDIIRTQPYPGFPTDMQAQTMAALTVADGTSIIIENIFESRYKHVEELIKMGADVKLEGRTSVIRGVDHLTGADLEAKDLRGGAALIIAGLKAQGKTQIFNPYHILRGYEDICRDLGLLGADINYVE